MVSFNDLASKRQELLQLIFAEIKKTDASLSVVKQLKLEDDLSKDWGLDSLSILSLKVAAKQLTGADMETDVSENNSLTISNFLAEAGIPTLPEQQLKIVLQRAINFFGIIGTHGVLNLNDYIGPANARNSRDYVLDQITESLKIPKTDNLAIPIEANVYTILAAFSI